MNRICSLRIAQSGMLGLLVGALTLVAGCNSDKPSTATVGERNNPTPLRVLVIDDPPLGEAIARQWKSRTESEIEVQNATLADIGQARRIPADVVVFPTPQLGLLAERGLIVPLPDDVLNRDPFSSRDWFSQIRLAESRWGHRTVAVPLGSPQLLLVYRPDEFERLQLTPPQTWEDYQAIAEKLQAAAGSEAEQTNAEKKGLAVLEPLAPGHASGLLLARAAAYVTHRDQVAPLFHPDTMEPLIQRAPFVRALEELAAANRLAGGVAEARLTPAEVVDRIAAGDAIMGLGFPAAVAAGRPKETDRESAELAFLPIPGSTNVYNFAVGEWEQIGGEEEPFATLAGLAGRQAAVSSSAHQPQAAVNFVGWLSSQENAGRVAPSSPTTAPFRKTQLPDTGRWLGLSTLAANSCATALEQSLSQQRSVLFPRIPGQAEYMAALDEAVQATLAQEKTAEQALQDAAAKWQEVTERLGRDAQSLAYRRSLNVADWP